MAHLQTVLIGCGRKLGAAVERCDVGGIQRCRYFRRVCATCLFNCALQDQAARIATRRFIAGRSVVFAVYALAKSAPLGPYCALKAVWGSHCEGTITPTAASPSSPHFGLSGATSRVTIFSGTLWL